MPCFWGIKSGQTPWNDANEFLKRLSVQHSDESALNENSFFYSNYLLPATDIYGDYDLQLELGVSNGIIYTISVGDFNVPNYYLNEFLRTNGQPDEIWVFTNSVSPTGIDKVGFLVSLYYKEKQMIVTYGRGQAIIGDEWLTGCIMYSPSLKIWTWDKSFKAPETTFNDLDVMRTSWKSISEATQGAFDTDKFYQSFSNSDTEACFQTPKNIWSEP